MNSLRTKKWNALLYAALVLGSAAVVCYSGYRLWLIQDDYRQEGAMHDAVMEYRPEETPGPESGMEAVILNQNVIDLQAQYPDAVGWLALPNTRIDYPFVQGGDNDYYLRRDINGAYALAGTIFIDYRCAGDFTSQNTILYGHHMKNGSMFGTLKAFAQKSFFDKNTHGVIYLPCGTLTLEFFAYMVINPDTEKELYKVVLSDTYFDYVRRKARHYRDIGLAKGDKIVTLSTCSYEFDNARMVLLAKVS